MKTGVKGTKYLLIPARVLAFVVFVFLLSGILNPVSAQRVRSPMQINFLEILTPEENCWYQQGGYNAFADVEGIADSALLQTPQTLFTGRTYEEGVEGSQVFPCEGVSRDPSKIINNMFFPENRGALGFVQSSTATILNQRPTSGTWFLEQKVYALTNPGKVYAQTSDINVNSYYPGTGFDLLKPIYSFWGWSVNVVYGFLILLIIVIAFAIMFQQRLGSKTAITLQTAIPSIALAMILVPFSYAISGAFIDFITLGTNVVHGFLLGPGSPGRGVYEEALKDAKANDCATTAIGDCNRGYYADDWRVSVLRFRESVDLRPVFTEVGGTLNLSGLDPLFSVLNILNEEALTGQVNPGAAAWFGAVLNLVLSVLMIWYGIQTAIRLLRKYVEMITMPIVSPFIFASAAIPGTGTKNVMMYVKSLAACSLNFIVAYAIILLVLIFTSYSFISNIPEIQSGSFVPPLIGLTTAIGGGSATLSRILFTIIGLGLYFSMPKMLAGIDKSLGVSDKLPAFISNAWDGFKDSTKVTRFGLRTAANLPGAGAQLMASGKKRLVDAGNSVRSVDLLGRRARQLALEKAAGVTTDNEKSAFYAEKQKMEKDYQEAIEDAELRRSAGDLAGAAAFFAKANAINAQSERLGFGSLSGKQDEKSRSGLTAKVLFEGDFSAGERAESFIITKGSVSVINSVFNGKSSTQLEEIEVGKLKLEATGGIELNNSALRVLLVHPEGSDDVFPGFDKINIGSNAIDITPGINNLYTFAQTDRNKLSDPVFGNMIFKIMPWQLNQAKKGEAETKIKLVISKSTFDKLVPSVQQQTINVSTPTPASSLIINASGTQRNVSPVAQNTITTSPGILVEGKTYAFPKMIIALKIGNKNIGYSKAFRLFVRTALESSKY